MVNMIHTVLIERGFDHKDIEMDVLARNLNA